MAGTSFIDLLRTLDPDPHTRGKQFERLTKWWLTNTPVTPFAPLAITNLWLWDEWPDRPGPDIGIDLVAELSDGSLCAVQAKCIDENADIPKSQLDSFISAASTKIYSHRLLIASTDGLSANARRMLQDQHVIRVMRTELERSVTAWPASINVLDAPVTQEKWKPRDHQAEAITNVTTGLATVDRGQMIMACGTGKTLTALWITEALNPTTTLVLVPSLNLLSQTLFEWARHTTSAWTYICVCSDDTVNKNNDEPISTVDDFPFEVTTDPTRIATFLATSGRKVIFSTYQSSAQIATALQTSPTTIDLAICDEAHRLTGKTDADYATILDNTKIPAVRRLFMTATPRTYTPTVTKKAEERGVEVTSMDDEAIYGPVLHKLSFGEAISRGLLSDYKVVIVGVTDPQVQELIDRRELVTVNNDVDTDARTLAAHIGLAKATKDYNLARTISFHSRINTAAKFAQDHPKILNWLPDTHRPDGTTWTDTISGAMNTGQRRRLLNQLRIDQPDRHALLTNARCLTEGVDVPTLDGIAFIDPRSSQVDIIQAVGRAIRKADNKETGFIVLPILFPATTEIKHALEQTAFKPIWAILNALKAHDDQLAQDLSALRTQLGHSGGFQTLPDKVIIDIPANVHELTTNFIDSLLISIVEHSTSIWDWWFGLLCKQVEELGTANLRTDFIVDGHRLGQWIGVQRAEYKLGQLKSDRMCRLESLNGWTWDTRESNWEDGYGELLQFIAQTGHARPPVALVTHGGFRLGQWAQVQRTTFAKKKLDRERCQRLDGLPGWTWNLKVARWFEKFDLFVTYGAKDGSYEEVPDVKVGDFNPAKWASRQRSRRSDLVAAQTDALEQLPGWSWAPQDQRFEFFYEHLRKWVETHGHANVPHKEKVDGIKIGFFVLRCRQDLKTGRLKREHQDKLELLSGWSWEPKNSQWFENLAAVRSLFESEATNNESDQVKPRSKLSTWMSAQRTAYREGELSHDRVQLLEEIAGWKWNPKDELEGELHWVKHLNALRQFYKTFGHCYVRNEYRTEDGTSLGTWVSLRRSQYKKGNLPLDRVRTLEEIPGWIWVADHEARTTAGIDRMGDLAWMEMFHTLERFIRANGHALVPKGLNFEGKRLGAWVRRQRHLESIGKLSFDRKTHLSGIEGWVWAGDAALVNRKGSNNGTTDANWDKKFQLLTRATFELGPIRVTSAFQYDGELIGRWAFRQRERKRLGALTKGQSDLLESIPGWTWNGRLTLANAPSSTNSVPIGPETQ